jgi:hypothetical protein
MRTGRQTLHWATFQTESDLPLEPDEGLIAFAVFDFLSAEKQSTLRKVHDLPAKPATPIRVQLLQSTRKRRPLKRPSKLSNVLAADSDEDLMLGQHKLGGFTSGRGTEPRTLDEALKGLASTLRSSQPPPNDPNETVDMDLGSDMDISLAGRLSPLRYARGSPINRTAVPSPSTSSVGPSTAVMTPLFDRISLPDDNDTSFDTEIETETAHSSGEIDGMSIDAMSIDLGRSLRIEEEGLFAGGRGDLFDSRTKTSTPKPLLEHVGAGPAMSTPVRSTKKASPLLEQLQEPLLRRNNSPDSPQPIISDSPEEPTVPIMSSNTVPTASNSSSSHATSSIYASSSQTV